MRIASHESYLSMVEGSVGSSAYRTLYAYTDAGECIDILEDGRLSCAYFVSSILTLFCMIPRPHATVAGLTRTLDTSPLWMSVPLAEHAPGDVVLYASRVGDDGAPNAHVGFIITDGEAVSTSSIERVVVRHSLTKMEPTLLYRYRGIEST